MKRGEFQQPPFVAVTGRKRLKSATVCGILTVLVTGCAAPIVTAAPNSCSSLLPSSWLEGVPPPPLPEGNDVGDWVSFGDAAIGKLDVANGRTSDAIGIIARCEERDKKAVNHATKGFFGRLFG
jgi:hypothetical protein